MAIIKITHNGNEYQAQETSKKLNRMIGYNLFVAYSNNVVNVTDSEFTAIKGVFTKIVDNNAATPAQLNYIRKLGVNLNGATIGKQTASHIIDAVKSGDGVGQFGLSFFDGSN